MLIDRLVAVDLLDAFCLDHKVLIDDGSDNTVKLKQLEIQKRNGNGKIANRTRKIKNGRERKTIQVDI